MRPLIWHDLYVGPEASGREAPGPGLSVSASFRLCFFPHALGERRGCAGNMPCSRVGIIGQAG